VIKVIVFAFIGLVLGLGGGSGFAVMKAKKTLAAVHDGTVKPDSTGGAKKSGEKAEPNGEEHEAVASHAKDSTTTIPQAPAVAPPTPTVAAGKPAATTDTGKANPAPVPGRIAKIFAAMSPKDAARVLQQMDDTDVQTVLSGLNERQAAAILSGFPAERAAAISRASLRGKKGAS